MKVYNGGQGQTEGRFGKFVFITSDLSEAESHGDIIRLYNVNEDNIIDCNRIGYETDLSQSPTVIDLAYDLEENFELEPDQALDTACDLVDHTLCPFHFFCNLFQDGEDAGEKAWDIQIKTATVAIDELGYESVAVPDEHGKSLMIDTTRNNIVETFQAS